MHDDVLLEQIRAYIRQYRATYTTDALRARLVADGAPADAVDAVIAELSQTPYYGPTPESATGAPEKKWGYGRFFLVLGVSVLVNVCVIVGAFALAFQFSSGAPIFGGLCLIAAAAEVALAVKYAKTNSAVTAGLIVAICLTPVAIGVLLLGVCAAVLVSMGNIGG
jgi:hypothetical protein